MSKSHPYLNLVGERGQGPASILRRTHESPELASVREAIDSSNSSLAAAKRLAMAGTQLVQAAYTRKPSKSIESVGAWLSDHMDAIRVGTDPYPLIRDLREAVLAAADELDSATGRDGALWRSTCNVVLGQIDPEPPKPTELAKPESPMATWLTRASAVPNYVWVMTMIGLLGIALGFGMAGLRKGKR